MELEEAIERLKRGIEDTMFSTLYSQEQEEEDIKTVLNHLTKQDKMIELMANKFSETVCFAPLNQKCNQGDKKFDKSKCVRCIKQYFEKKAEEEK